MLIKAAASGSLGIVNKLLPVFLFLAALSANLLAQNYTVTDLGSLDGTSSVAYGINSSGQVVGYATSGSNSLPVLFSGNGTGIVILGNTAGTARAINDGGQIVGMESNGTVSEPVLFSGSGSNNTSLGGLPGGTGEGTALAINNSQQIVGSSYTSSSSPAVNFVASGNADLGSVGGGSNTDGSANGINDSGIIVGQSMNVSNHVRATRFASSGGANLDLGTLGGSSGVAYAINNANQIVGSSTTALNNFHATLFNLDGSSPIDLGTLSGSISNAHDINNNGVIVGSASTANRNHAFIYRNGTMLDLNSLIPANSGVEIIEAWGINDAGQIAASGVVGQAGANGVINGNLRALRLDPDSAPSVTYTIFVRASPNRRGTVTGNQAYPAGTYVSVVAKPKSGSVFVSWTEKGRVVSRKRTYKFYVSQTRSLVAHFSPRS